MEDYRGGALEGEGAFISPRTLDLDIAAIGHTTDKVRLVVRGGELYTLCLMQTSFSKSTQL